MLGALLYAISRAARSVANDCHWATAVAARKLKITTAKVAGSHNVHLGRAIVTSLNLGLGPNDLVIPQPPPTEVRLRPSDALSIALLDESGERARSERSHVSHRGARPGRTSTDVLDAIPSSRAEPSYTRIVRGALLRS